jgi:hypothetical protein
MMLLMMMMMSRRRCLAGGQGTAAEAPEPLFRHASRARPWMGFAWRRWGPSCLLTVPAMTRQIEAYEIGCPGWVSVTLVIMLSFKVAVRCQE